MIRPAVISSAVLVLATLSGCVGGGPEEVGLPPPDASDVRNLPGAGAVTHGADGILKTIEPPPLLLGLQRSLGLPSYEPTIGVSGKGVLFMQSSTRGALFYETPSVARSRDQGATWELVGPKLPTGDGNPPNTNDPFVHVDRLTGRVFTDDNQGTACSVLSWSDDEGRTWTTNPVACGTPGVNDHNVITTGKGRRLAPVGYPNVVYYCVNRVADTACAASHTGGSAWGPLVTAFPGVHTEGDVLCGGLQGQVKTGPDGKVYLPRNFCGFPAVGISEDDALTWTIRIVDRAHKPDESNSVAVAVDEANHIHVLWVSKSLPYLASSKDGGKTWTKPKMVAAPGVTHVDFPYIAAGAQDRVAFGYVGTTMNKSYRDPKPDDLVFFFFGAQDPYYADWSWNAYLTVALDPLADDPTFRTTTMHEPTDPIARGRCGGWRCVGSDGNGVGDFLDMVIDDQGRPWVALVDMCNDRCATDSSVPNTDGVGFAGTVNVGPALSGDARTLAALVTSPRS